MHGLLTVMYDGTIYTSDKIIKQFSKEIFEEAKNKDYIENVGKNSFGIDLYQITKTGKNFYNGKN